VRNVLFIPDRYCQGMNYRIWPTLLLSALALVPLSGCGSGTTLTSQRSTPAPRSAGDIPDTANYLTYSGLGFTVKYVEGWSIQRYRDGRVTIGDKDSAENVVPIKKSAQQLTTYAANDLAALHKTSARFHLIVKRSQRLPAGSAMYAQYRTLSASDPVTGKQVPIVVDRYYIEGATKRAILTLSTPIGVDNVDAFRLIARSFTWS
jgi:hypothetical protein